MRRAAEGEEVEQHTAEDGRERSGVSVTENVTLVPAQASVPAPGLPDEASPDEQETRVVSHPRPTPALAVTSSGNVSGSGASPLNGAHVDLGPVPQPFAGHPVGAPRQATNAPNGGQPKRTGHPDRVPWRAASSWGPTTFTITAPTAAGASYLLGWVSGLLVYFNERQNRFVRFHAVQSILLTGVLSVFGVLAYITAALLNDVYTNTRQHVWETLSQGTVALAVLIIAIPWLTAMIAAWSGTYLRLPLVGEYAERFAAPPIESQPPRAG